VDEARDRNSPRRAPIVVRLAGPRAIARHKIVEVEVIV
jgi:hypothetical protein